MSLFEVVLRTPRVGPWRAFQDPISVVRASGPDDVIGALTEIDRLVRTEGCYAAGVVTYEAAGAFGLPVHSTPPDGLPLVCFGIYPPDHVRSHVRLQARGGYALGEWQPALDHAAYLASVDRIQARIEADGTDQINCMFRLTASFDGDPLALLCALDAAQAGQWGGFVDDGRHVICSASPETLVSLEGDRILCAPMKGTAPRGLYAAADRRQAERLHSSDRHRAEHAMIAGMVRADLDRIARPGSVEIRSMFELERSSLEWQMTSTVTAEAREVPLASLFEALFPSGSVTGSPKRNSMAIIRDVEPGPRGIHTGAIGYLSPKGRGHFNVAIRSIAIDRKNTVAEFGLGGGIVRGSAERDDYDECLLKASILLSTRPRAPGTHGGSTSGVVSYAVSQGVLLLETIRWAPSEGFVRLARHLDRLSASAACFGYDCDGSAIGAMLENAVIDLRGPAKVRILLSRDGTVACEAIDLVDSGVEPLRIALAPDPIDTNDVFLYHKTTRRDVYDRARASRPHADAVVLWNAAGDVTESTDANIVVSIDGQKVTPPIECGLLAGTLRAELLDRGEIVERRVTVADLRDGDEIWLINSVRGWMKAVALTSA